VVPEDLPANTVDVRAELTGDPGARSFYMTSSCGVCGKGALEEVARSAPRLPEGPRVARDVLASLPDRLKQPAFDITGGLHATGLFNTEGELLLAREDVGRHNAMDKVVGRCLLDWPSSSCRRRPSPGARCWWGSGRPPPWRSRWRPTGG